MRGRQWFSILLGLLVLAVLAVGLWRLDLVRRASEPPDQVSTRPASRTPEETRALMQELAQRARESASPSAPAISGEKLARFQRAWDARMRQIEERARTRRSPLFEETGR
jgi:hypothetical protein